MPGKRQARRISKQADVRAAAVERLIGWAVEFYNSDALFVKLGQKERGEIDGRLRDILQDLGVDFDGRHRTEAEGLTYASASAGAAAAWKENIRRARDKENLAPDDAVEF